MSFFRVTWKGAKCFCSPGYQPNGLHCIDTDECNIDGSCDQKCKNTDGSYLCSCEKGYKLLPPSTCKAINEPTGEPATLLISTAETIQHVALNGGTITKHSALDSYAIDFDHRGESLCWITRGYTQHGSTNGAGAYCASIHFDKGWKLATPDLVAYSSVDRIVRDWASGNWYFVDESRGSVFLCKGEERLMPMSSGEQGGGGDNKLHCILVFTTKWSKPKGLALDPEAGTLTDFQNHICYVENKS